MRVLILYSVTGGGHKAAALAIKAALADLDPSVEVRLFDAYVDASPWPFNRFPAMYEFTMRKARWVYGTLFHFWNGPLRARWMADLGYPAVAGRLRRALAAQEADVVISVHPLLTRTISRALRSLQPKPPFAIVVTDMLTGHWSWFDKEADHIFIPHEGGVERLTSRGFDPARIEVTGQMVHPRCGVAVARRDELRARFGWREPVILMVGGGEGMGRLEDYVRAAAEARLLARVVVVCGRNEALRQKLSEVSFPIPVEVKGFVDNLHEIMAASDLLVTKGGPGSVMEGCVAGLPMVIYDYLPGQEIGNVRLAEQHGFGIHLPRPADVVAQLRRWLDHPAEREKAAAAARAFATPDSASRVARWILRQSPARP